jgi:hypothetical protein
MDERALTSTDDMAKERDELQARNDSLSTAFQAARKSIDVYRREVLLSREIARRLAVMVRDGKPMCSECDGVDDCQAGCFTDCLIACVQDEILKEEGVSK